MATPVNEPKSSSSVVNEPKSGQTTGGDGFGTATFGTSVFGGGGTTGTSVINEPKN